MAMKIERRSESSSVKRMPIKLEPKKIIAPKNTGRKDLRGIIVDIVEELSEVSENILDFSYLIYGPKKIGKTKFSSLFGCNEGSTYFLMFEKLAPHLSIRQSLMTDMINEQGEIEATAWLVAEAYLEDLILTGSKKNIRTICADGLLAMYEKAFIQGCREGGFQYPGMENDGGRSWNKIKSTFYRFTNKLVESNFGIIFNCHDVALQLEKFDGVKTQIVPNLPKYADEFVRHKIDNVFYFHLRGRDRWLQLRGDETVYAACAFEKNFLTTKGDPIWLIPMGNSAEQGFQNFMNAFNNKQSKTYEEVTKQDIAELKKQKGDTIIRKTKEKRK